MKPTPDGNTSYDEADNGCNRQEQTFAGHDRVERLSDRRGRLREAILTNFDRSNKAIAALGNGLDILCALRTFAQGLSQDGDVGGERAFFYDRVCPDLLQQLIFCNRIALGFDQHGEEFNHFGTQGQALATTKQYASHRIKTEGPEFVVSSGGHGWNRQEIHKKNSSFRKGLPGTPIAF